MRARRAEAGERDREAGSAIVEFVLVSLLVLTVCLGVMQLAIALHVRTVLIDSAAEGARHAARAGHDPSDGVARTRELITGVLPEGYATDIGAEYAAIDLGGGRVRRVVRVDVQAPVPLFGLLGPAVVNVSGRAVAE